MGTSEYVYGENIQVRKLLSPDGNNQFYTYDSKDNLESVWTINDQAYEYSYDSLNRLEREKCFLPGLGKHYKYVYNELGQLSQVQNLNDNSVVEKEFEHDGYGRLFKSTINGSVKFYLYDDYGNPTSIGGVATTWTRGTLLSSYGSTSYSYNHKGVRYSKTWTEETGTYNSNYYLDGTKILGEDSKGRKLRYFYDVIGLTGLTVDGVKYQYVKDMQGNVIKIYRLSDKQLAAAYVYDAWGNHTIICNVNGIADLNPFRYRSYYYDVETGYYYLNSRYYDPAICRFISPDTIDYLDPEDVNSLDLYRYCVNNPVNMIDSTGHFPILISLAIIFGIGALSGVAGVFIGDVVNAIATGEWAWSSWETYAGAAIGYGLGAIAITFLGATWGLAIGSGLSTLTGMSLEKATGTNSRGWLEIGLSTAGSFAIGAVMGHFTKGLQIKGITTGRGSFQHVMKTQFANMVRHGYNISLKTAAKSLVALTVSRQIIGNIGKGFLRAGMEWWEYFIYGDARGLGWI